MGSNVETFHQKLEIVPPRTSEPEAVRGRTGQRLVHLGIGRRYQVGSYDSAAFLLVGP